MKISIITPSYNQGQFIEQTICSVLNQEYKNLEYIIIDGGSTDNTVDTILKYEREINYWVSEKDLGQSNAINKGFKKASGDIITWINSDDLLLPGALHKVAEYFDALPKSTGVVHGGTLLFENNKDIKLEYTYGTSSLEKYLSGMAFSQPAAFFRKMYMDKVGLLNENLHYGMDYDLFARLACVCKFQPVDTIFSKYRLHEESKSVAHSDKFREDWNRVFLSLCRHLGWEELIDDLSSFDLEFGDNKFLLHYDFTPSRDIMSDVNRQKVLFYFLGDQLLHYYWYDQRDAARQLLQKMKSTFPKQWLEEDKRIQNVIRKLKIPDMLLRSLKSFKQYLRG